MPGDNSKWVPPDSIPNSEVKPLYAYDSVAFWLCQSRLLPGSLFNIFSFILSCILAKAGIHINNLRKSKLMKLPSFLSFTSFAAQEILNQFPRNNHSTAQQSNSSSSLTSSFFTPNPRSVELRSVVSEQQYNKQEHRWMQR